MKKVIVLLLSVFLFIPNLSAEEKFINVYLFHSKTCGHCKSELAWFDEYLDENDNVKLYEYEVSDSENRKKYLDVKEILDNNSNGVPFLVVGSDVVVGFGNSTPSKIESLIEHYLKIDYKDEVGEYLGVSLYEGELGGNEEDVQNSAVGNNSEIVEGENNNNVGTNDENVDDESNDVSIKDEYEVPIMGKFNAKNVSLPILSIIMGFVDGFNPCALWILVFLITMLFNMKDKKKMWALGLTFILTSGIVYMLFMISWLNLAIFMNSVTVIRSMISVFAIIFGGYNIYNFIKTKNDAVGCSVTNEKSRGKIMDRIKNVIYQRKFIFSLIGFMLLAVSVNILELLCSLGLPVIFTQVLSVNNLSTLEYSVYILLYIIFFLIDDLVIFIIAMKTLQIKAISNKYTRYSHLIGGIIMLLIGLLMLAKPEWLMFNF